MEASLRNAILLPSGDHAGLRSTWAGSLVSWTTAEPSVFITKIWYTPSRALTEAILVPSGDHAGWLLYPPGVLVNCVGAVPSALIVKTSRSPPPRNLPNAILLPSGDHAGNSSVLVFVSPTTPVPSALMR